MRSISQKSAQRFSACLVTRPPPPPPHPICHLLRFLLLFFLFHYHLASNASSCHCLCLKTIGVPFCSGSNHSALPPDCGKSVGLCLSFARLSLSSLSFVPFFNPAISSSSHLSTLNLLHFSPSPHPDNPVLSHSLTLCTLTSAPLFHLSLHDTLTCFFPPVAHSIFFFSNAVTSSTHPLVHLTPDLLVARNQLVLSPLLSFSLPQYFF